MTSFPEDSRLNKTVCSQVSQSEYIAAYFDCYSCMIAIDLWEVTTLCNNWSRNIMNNISNIIKRTRMIWVIITRLIVHTSYTLLYSDALFGYYNSMKVCPVSWQELETKRLKGDKNETGVNIKTTKYDMVSIVELWERINTK